jgi:transposase
MLPSGIRIFVCTEPFDMRRSFDGLAAATREQLGLDPESGVLVAFVNRRRNRLKMLWWDRTGYCIVYKRLEWGVFRLPQTLDPGRPRVAIDRKELAKIMEGVKLPPKRHRLHRAARTGHSLFSAAVEE